ncbi:MAG: hypothetical protein KKA60_16350 [Proteobacteria bacterium]|nr:hypothetical protein [Pseudomonadota bacterium]
MPPAFETLAARVRRLLRPRDVSLVLLAAVLALVLNGYWYGTGDSDLYIPLVEHAADSSMFPGDYLFSEPTAGASFWVPAMGFANRFVSTQALFFGGYCLSLVLFFAATLALCRVLFPDREAALFALLFLVTWKPLGGAMMRTIESIYSLRIAAMPFSIAFLAAWFAGRHRLAAVLAALTFWIHPLSGAPLALLVVLGAATDPRPGRLRRVAGISGLYALAVSPLFLKVLFSALGGSGPPAFFFPTDPLWLSVARARLGYLFLSQWNPGDLLLAGAYAGLLASVLVYRRLSGTAGEKDRLAWVLLAAVGVLYLVAWVFGDLYPVAMVIELQLLRSLYLVVITSMAWAGWMAAQGARMAREADPAPDAPVSARTLGFLRRLFPLAMVLLLVSRAEGHALGILILAAGWGALFGERLPVLFRRGLGAAAVSMAALGVAGGLLPLSTGIAVVLAVVFLFLELARARNRDRFSPRALPRAAWVAVAVVALAITWTGLENRSFFQSVHLPGHIPETPYIRAAQWCRDHTPEDALFLVPPSFRGFRVFSGRPVAGTIKDGGPALFSKAFLWTWLTRMKDLRDYESLDEARLLELGRKYGAQFAVVEAGRGLSLPRLWTDGFFSVVLLSRELGLSGLRERGCPEGDFPGKDRLARVAAEEGRGEMPDKPFARKNRAPSIFSREFAGNA